MSIGERLIVAEDPETAVKHLRPALVGNTHWFLISVNECGDRILEFFSPVVSYLAIEKGDGCGSAVVFETNFLNLPTRHRAVIKLVAIPKAWVPASSLRAVLDDFLGDVPDAIGREQDVVYIVGDVGDYKTARLFLEAVRRGDSGAAGSN